MNKVLITGDKGFIGQHLSGYLASEGYSVLGYDLIDGKDIRLMKPSDLAGVVYVFHLAALSKVPLSVQDPLETNSHNIDGTLNVLWCALKAGVKRVIFASSSSVYGNQAKLPISEDAQPKPLSPYGLQKLAGEHYCRLFYELYGLSTISLRYFNVYGENMPLKGEHTAMIANFFQKAANHEPLPIYGGSQTRDFTYVGDICRANLLAALSDKIGKGEVLNIGSGISYSIKEIADIISPFQKIYPSRKGEPLHTKADIRLAKKTIGYEPTIDLLQWLKAKKRQ